MTGRSLPRPEGCEAKGLKVTAAVAQLSLESVCGDAFCSRQLGGHGHLLAISDGMGSGRAAGTQSTAALKLLSLLFEAGFGLQTVFRAINYVLRLRSEEEIFASVDMCMVNDVSGMADFVKVGAEESYILRDGRAEPVLCPAPPLGILEQVEPIAVRRQLFAGDIIVMVSDGVSGEDMWLEEALRRLDVCTAVDELAERILEISLRKQPVQDDRTVLVARITSDRIGHAIRPIKQRFSAR